MPQTRRPLAPGYGPKIDILVKTPTGWQYLCSTNWSRTCKEAVQRYQERHPTESRKLRAWVADTMSLELIASRQDVARKLNISEGR